jgi:hypothetical protein
MDEREPPMVSVRDVPRATTDTCLTCAFFISTDPVRHRGVCGWIPPPCLQEGSNKRRPSVHETYYCSGYKVKS